MKEGQYWRMIVIAADGGDDVLAKFFVSGRDMLSLIVCCRGMLGISAFPPPCEVSCVSPDLWFRNISRQASAFDPIASVLDNARTRTSPSPLGVPPLLLLIVTNFQGKETFFQVLFRPPDALCSASCPPDMRRDWRSSGRSKNGVGPTAATA